MIKRTTYQNLWNVAKAVLRGEPINLNVCNTKEEILQLIS